MFFIVVVVVVVVVVLLSLFLERDQVFFLVFCCLFYCWFALDKTKICENLSVLVLKRRGSIAM